MKEIKERIDISNRQGTESISKPNENAINQKKQ